MCVTFCGTEVSRFTAIALNEESRVAKGLPSILSFEVLPNGLYRLSEVKLIAHSWNRR